MRTLAAAAAAILAVSSLAVATRVAVAAPADGHYIVVLRDASVHRHGIHADWEYHHALTGFAATLSDSDLDALRADPGVEYVEPDEPVVPDAGGPYRADVGAGDASGLGVSAYAIDCGTDSADVLRYWAPAARVSVIGACGAESAVLGAIDQVMALRRGPAVVSLGLSGGPSRALDEAVATSVASGIVYAVTAGNWNQDACGHSPGRSSAVITVGANQWRDFGPCVTLFAGTPLVAAAAARYLQGHPRAHPSEVKSRLILHATTGVLHNLRTGTPNRILRLP